MVDPERIREKLAALSAYRIELGKIAAYEQAALSRYSRRYLLQAGIQVCIDLANHLIPSEGWRTATDYREAFARMAEQEIVDNELASRLQAMVDMRDQLVHLYDEVDDALVARMVDENLGDWEAFARAIASQLSTRMP